jgi:hypothetical protein
MLTLYNYLETLIEEHNGRQWYFEARLNHFASELFEILEIADTEEQEHALARTISACNSLRIPVTANFKKVYRYDGSWITTDWKISPLACYLITINCDPSHNNVAKAQLFFAMNQVRQGA